jgi:hypothetical protein
VVSDFLSFPDCLQFAGMVLLAAETSPEEFKAVLAHLNIYLPIYRISFLYLTVFSRNTARSHPSRWILIYLKKLVMK